MEVLEVRNCKSDGNMGFMLYEDFRNMNEKQKELSKKLGDEFIYREVPGYYNDNFSRELGKTPINTAWFEEDPDTKLCHCIAQHK